MARLLTTDITPIVGLVIKTIKEDDSADTLTLAVDDEVTNLRYVKDHALEVVSGRVAKINYKVNTLSKKVTTAAGLKSQFATGVIADTVEIDASEVKHSNVVTVPLREIVENAGVVGVKRMKYFLTYGITMKTTLTDGSENEFTMFEGDVVTDAKCLGKNGDEKFSGKLGCIGYDASLNPTTLYFNVGGKLKAVDAIAMISIGGVVPATTDDTPIADAISGAVDGKVNLASGTFAGNINLSGDLTIIGNNTGISGTAKSRGGSDETILNGKINIAPNANVVLDGLTLTGDTLIEAGSGNLEIKNCRVLDLQAESGRLYPIKTNGVDPITLVVEDCYFGDNVASGPNTSTVYNMFELNAPLKDGSKFSNNYFTANVQTHNSINIYNAEEGATITISNNIWEKSANAVRIGIKGEPTVTVLLENNRYDSTDDSDPDWAGLLLIQPYGKATTSYANLTVILNNTKHSDNLQIWYKYAGGGDMQFTDANVPTVIVDGVTELEPIVA